MKRGETSLKKRSIVWQKGRVDMVRSIRINLFTVTVILICIGIVMIYSSSSIYALERYKDSFFSF